MRHRIVWLLLICMMLSALSGCDLWAEGNYYSVEKHQPFNDPTQPDNLEVSTLDEITTVLSDLVRDAVEECTLNVDNIPEENISEWMDNAVDYMKNQDPMGAYCVENITYEVGTSFGDTAVAVDIAYNRTRSEILRINHSETMDELFRMIKLKLSSCDTGAVILVENYEDTDFAQMVSEYAYQSPDIVMELPNVIATVYPDSGQKRVVELAFTYQTSREDLRTMQQSVQQVFTSAQLYVSENSKEIEKFEQLYSFLMERFDYKIETSITPSYSLLYYGIGDCRAFANVYAAMCSQVGLNCDVISGTRDGNAWVWNMVQIEDSCYYIDLIRCSETGNFQLHTDKDMEGYVWHYAAEAAPV